MATPDVDVANLEFGLHVAFQEVVNAGAKDAGSASEERIHGMRNGEDGVGTEHVIVIHGSETVANVVDDDFDGTREEGVAGSGRDEAIPQAAAVSDFDAGLCENIDDVAAEG